MREHARPRQAPSAASAPAIIIVGTAGIGSPSCCSKTLKPTNGTPVARTAPRAVFPRSLRQRAMSRIARTDSRVSRDESRPPCSSRTDRNAPPVRSAAHRPARAAAQAPSRPQRSSTSTSSPSPRMTNAAALARSDASRRAHHRRTRRRPRYTKPARAARSLARCERDVEVQDRRACLTACGDTERRTGDHLHVALPSADVAIGIVPARMS